MSLAIQRASFFIADFEIQFAWYVEKAGGEVAWRFQSALDDSLRKLSNRPDLGRIRHFRSPKLRGLRSYVLITNEFDAARLRAACERRRQNAPLFSQVVHISPAAVEVVYREGGAEGATALRQHIATGRLMSFQAWLESIGAGPSPTAHRSRKK